jgi:hypothetical protein
VNEHIADRALFLVALAEQDPERRRAEEHARGCEACLLALAEGRQLLKLLKDAMPLPAPTPEMLAQVAARISKECAAARRNRRVLAFAVACGAVAAWLVHLVIGDELRLELVRIIVSLTVLAGAVAALFLVLGRGRAAVLWLIGLSGLFAVAASRVHGFEPKVGTQCTTFVLTEAAIPWLVAIIVAHVRGIPLKRWDTMAAAAGGALASHAAQHLNCPMSHADAHLLVFHFGAVILAAGLGAINPLTPRRLVSAEP